jgi:hypothetical protein
MSQVTGSFVALVLIALAVVGGLAYYIHKTRALAQQNSQTTVALCALRADLDLRIASSNELLTDHPRGPIFGIPRSVIEMSVANSKRTREALSDLDCE